MGVLLLLLLLMVMMMMMMMSIAATRLRRWRELRPVERQRWCEEAELQIGTYPAPTRGSKHVREQILGARPEMGLCDPWWMWMSRRSIGWQQVLQGRGAQATSRSRSRGRRKRCGRV